MPEAPSNRAVITALFPLLGVVMFIAVVLTCGEMIVRLFLPYNTPDTLKKHSLPYVQATYTKSMFEPVNGQIEINNAKAWGVKISGPTNTRAYFINEHGYRGASFTLPKPQGVRRIVVLGGSTVFDQNADEGSDWPHLLDKFLKEKGHYQVEVINAGIPGHTSSDVLGRLYTEIWQWEPDYLIIYEAWNDIEYFNDLSYNKPLVRLVKPIHPEADPFRSYQGTLDYLLSYSQLYMKIRNRYFAWIHPVNLEGSIREERKDNIGNLGLKQFRMNMETFVDASRNIRAIPILVTQPTLVSPTNNAEDRKRIAYGYVGLSHEGILRAYDKCRQVILEVGREKNAYVLDLLPQLQGKSELFTDHDHTTPQGSQEVAVRVANFLDALLNVSATK